MTQDSSTSESERGPLAVVKMVFTGIAIVIAGVVSFFLDLLGFVGTIIVNAVIIVGAYLIHPTLGTIVLGGYIVFFVVLTPLAMIFGDSLMDRIMSRESSAPASPGDRTESSEAFRAEVERVAAFVRNASSEEDARRMLAELPEHQRPSQAAIRAFFRSGR